MRTNIDIDDDLMSQAMKAGPYQTKKEAVEAGLKLLARQVAYREILKELHESNPVIAKAEAAGPEFWQDAFARLTV